MGDIADDRDLEPGDPPLGLTDREDVEQALGGVLVRAVAGVDDRGLEVAREVPGRARGLVADDEDVDAHGLDVLRRVDEGLALLGRAAFLLKVDDVGGEPLRGEPEADPRARAGLEEEVDDDAPAERRDLLDRARADLAKALGGVEDELDLVLRQLLEAQEVAPRPAPRRRLDRGLVAARAQLGCDARGLGRHFTSSPWMMTPRRRRRRRCRSRGP